MSFTPSISQSSVEYLKVADSKDLMKHIEEIGRLCYKSEDKITEDSYQKFIVGLIERKHEAMIEHFSISLKFHIPRHISHEAVRHRLCAFAQTSTRYVNYSKDKFGNNIQVIEPFYFDIDAPRIELVFPLPMDNFENITSVKTMGNEFDVWLWTMMVCNWSYLTLTKTFKKQAQEARAVLPLSTATDLVITANPREWRHIIKLRSLGDTGSPHPAIQKVMDDALVILNNEFPQLFGDLYARRFNS